MTINYSKIAVLATIQKSHNSKEGCSFKGNRWENLMVKDAAKAGFFPVDGMDKKSCPICKEYTFAVVPKGTKIVEGAYKKAIIFQNKEGRRLAACPCGMRKLEVVAAEATNPPPATSSSPEKENPQPGESSKEEKGTETTY